MQTILTALALLAIAGLLLTLWAIHRAPNGYQDETGFHFGDSQSPDAHIDAPTVNGRPPVSFTVFCICAIWVLLAGCAETPAGRAAEKDSATIGTATASADAHVAKAQTQNKTARTAFQRIDDKMQVLMDNP